MIYDVHAHCVPASLLDRLLEDPGRYSSALEQTQAGLAVDMAGFHTLPIGDDLVSLDRRLETMDQQGIDVQVVSAFIDLVGYEMESVAGADWSRLYNETLVEESARRPERLRSLATVPIQDGSRAARELEYAVTKLGMLGAQVGTHVGNRQLDDPDLEPLWATASELRCLMLLHPRDPLGPLPIDDYMIRHLIGRPADTTLAAAYLMLSGVLDRYPGFKLIVAHGGGFLPYQIGRIRQGVARPSSVTGIASVSDPTDLMRRMYYDTILNDPAALRALLELVGSERVLIGTDYPYGLGDTDPLGSLSRAGIHAEVRNLIAERNFEMLVADVIGPQDDVRDEGAPPPPPES